MVSGFNENVLGLDKVGVNELVNYILRSEVTALLRASIILISYQRIKEFAAKYVVYDLHNVLRAKTETPATSA